MKLEIIHKKTGNLYEFIGFAKNATNKNEGDIMVLYKSKKHDKVTFAKEYHEFIYKFQIPDFIYFKELEIIFLRANFPKPTNISPKFYLYREDENLDDDVFHGSFDTLEEAKLEEIQIIKKFRIRLKNGKFADPITWISKK
jgi:hypothetical protein